MTRTRKPGFCPICEKVFRDSSSIKAHLLTHTNERPFKCSDCGSFHRTKYDLDQHSRYVHGSEKRPLEKQVQCIMCKKTGSNLNRHLRMHIREKPYSCSICDQEFLDSGHLNRHLKSHEKLKGDPCIFCEKTLSIFSNPDDHILSHIKEKPYFCKCCPSSFSLQSNLVAHIRNVHLRERRFSCEICKKTFYSRSERDNHVSVHLNEKPFQCKICSKRFKSSLGLKCHLDNHNDLRKPTFACGKCSNTYRSKSNLSRHEKTKHELNQCILCGKNITTGVMAHLLKHTTGVMAHLLKHTNERHFLCKYCDKDFQSISHLQSHVHNIHSTERPRHC